jgi:drug/metabolite transporter (DMT)-like permease
MPVSGHGMSAHLPCFPVVDRRRIAHKIAKADSLTASNRDDTRPAFLPYVAMGVGIVALGFSAIFVRWAGAPGPVTGFYRMAIASLILLPFALGRHGTPTRWPAVGIRWAVLGGLFLAIDIALWNTSVGMTSAANATLFANTAPLWVALAARLFFREKLAGRFWLSLLLTLSGAAAVLGLDFSTHITLGLGDLLAISASLFYAGYYLMTQRGRDHLGPLAYVWLAGVASSGVLLVVNLAAGLPLTGYPAQAWLAFLGLALITQVVGYVAVGYALGHLPASLVAPTMVGQPVVTALLAIPLLGEHLTTVQWLGGAAVLIGIYLVHRSA